MAPERENCRKESGLVPGEPLTSSFVSPSSAPSFPTGTERNGEGSALTDIEIFIATYNRPELLRRALGSVMAQTVGRLPITVLDNGDDPATREVVVSFADGGVRYHTSKHLGTHGNLLLAQSLASRSYVMVFHDDDQMHPDYIQCVQEILRAFPEVNLVSGSMTRLETSEPRVFDTSITPTLHLLTQCELAIFWYTEFYSWCPLFPLAVYRTSVFRQLDLVGITEDYGKWSDVPILIKTAKDGQAAIIPSSCGWYGVHPGQDSINADTLPAPGAWIRFHRLFHEILGDNPMTVSGLAFCVQNFRLLCYGLIHNVRQDFPLDTLLANALSQHGMTARSFRFRRLTRRRIVRNLFYHYFRQRFLASKRVLPPLSLPSKRDQKSGVREGVSRNHRP